MWHHHQYYIYYIGTCYRSLYNLIRINTSILYSIVYVYNTPRKHIVGRKLLKLPRVANFYTVMWILTQYECEKCLFSFELLYYFVYGKFIRLLKCRASYYRKRQYITHSYITFLGMFSDRGIVSFQHSDDRMWFGDIWLSGWPSCQVTR